MDLQQAFDEGFDVLKGYVDRSFDAYAKRIETIEAKLSALPIATADGLDAVKSDVESLRKAIADLPEPVEPPALPDIPAMVAETVAAIPAPQDGKSVTVEELAPLVAESVQKAVAALPAPKDGCGIKELLIDRDGALVATMDDGRIKNLGPVVGRNGVDVDMAVVEQSIAEKFAAIPVPKDGEDGFSLDDFDATLMEDGRTVLLSFTRGETSFKVELALPVMIYRGVFKEGQTYAKGDTVTWGGSLWHCDVDETAEKPDSPGKHWTLAAKRGRDGKDFTPKPDNGPPKVKV